MECENAWGIFSISRLFLGSLGGLGDLGGLGAFFPGCASH